ncbi:MAG: hypothetical protein ACRDTD_28635, partial [Pseudonocardiaceae bacterium]
RSLRYGLLAAKTVTMGRFEFGKAIADGDGEVFIRDESDRRATLIASSATPLRFRVCRNARPCGSKLSRKLGLLTSTWDGTNTTLVMGPGP